MASNDERGVEIGTVYGHSRRTAEVLADAGLIELVNLGYINARAFLGKYRPVDDLADDERY